MKKLTVILLFLLVLAACSVNAGEEKAAVASEETLVNEIIEVASSLTSEILNAEGVGRHMMMIDPTKETPAIEIIRIDGKELADDETKRIQELIKDTVNSKTEVEFKVTLRAQTKAEIGDNSWQPIFNAVVEETEKNFEEYRGFAYSFSPEPLQIIIKTTLEDNSSDHEKIDAIEQFVQKIVDKKIQELSVEEIPYKILIRSKGNREIN